MDDLVASYQHKVKLPVTSGGSEAAVLSQVRLEHSSKTGGIIWRNNVGQAKDERGNYFRFGLCNDSKRLNNVFKSGDLIGIQPIIVTPLMIGSKIGQFVSREIKHAGWVYTGTPREKAQLEWANLINSLGGDAKVVTA